MVLTSSGTLNPSFIGGNQHPLPLTSDVEFSMLNNTSCLSGGCNILKAKTAFFDFCPFLTGLDHIIEIYDFMPSLQTADIAMPFASFKYKINKCNILTIKVCIFRNDFRMKWVDDTHALGIFSCASLGNNN